MASKIELPAFLCGFFIARNSPILKLNRRKPLIISLSYEKLKMRQDAYAHIDAGYPRRACVLAWVG
jgi:hypothetical protein